MSEPTFWDKLKSKAAEVRDKTEELAIDLKIKADERIAKAKQSEAWANTKDQSSKVWEQTKEGSKKAWENVKVGAQIAADNIQGKTSTVTFNDSKLGMTLARDEKSQRAVVSRVDPSGAAAAMGVSPGDFVLSVRPGFPGDGSEEAVVRIQGYDHLMNLFPQLGRPVSITFLTPRKDVPTAGVINFSMEEEVLKATKIVSSLTTEKATNPDALVPQEILRRARGIAFLRVAKIGWVGSVKAGTGIVVARLGSNLDSWSAPCAIGTVGLGVGMQFGVELTDFMIVLNTAEAVEAFAAGNQVSLGGDVGIAVGPVGRNASVSGNIHGGHLASKEGDQPVHIAPCYAYSHSKGLFVGISFEGAGIKPRNDINEKFYGAPLTPREILSGMTLPPAAAEPLYEALALGMADDLSAEAEPAPRPPVTVPPRANPFVDRPPDLAAAAASAPVASSDLEHPSESTSVAV